MRRFVAFVLALWAGLLSPVAVDAGKSRSFALLPTQVISTAGGAVSVISRQPLSSSAYLSVSTTLETAAASLTVTVEIIDQVNALSDTVVCSLGPITDNTVSLFLVGSLATAGGAVLSVCDFPLSRATRWTFTVTGAGADFTVEASLEYLGDRI